MIKIDGKSKLSGIKAKYHRSSWISTHENRTIIYSLISSFSNFRQNHFSDFETPFSVGLMTCVAQISLNESFLCHGHRDSQGMTVFVAKIVTQGTHHRRLGCCLKVIIQICHRYCLKIIRAD